MRKWYEILRGIEYAFIIFVIAAFSVVGVAGFLFGLKLSEWAKWQAGLVTTTALIAGAYGAVFGWHLGFDSEQLRLAHRSSRITERHQNH